MADGGAALLIALLVNHGPELLYIPSRAVNRATDGYRGEGETDARDAFFIADQARLRHDLKPMRPSDEATIELKLFTARRTDLACDRNRAINRLRGTLTSMFPALERVLDWHQAQQARLTQPRPRPGGLTITPRASVKKERVQREPSAGCRTHTVHGTERR
jgi:hypothetical protein